MVVCLVLAIDNSIQISGNPLMTNQDFVEFSLDGSTPYPTLSFCPVQFYDRWNLAKALLNEVAMFDDHGTPSSKVFKQFKVGQRIWRFPKNRKNGSKKTISQNNEHSSLMKGLKSQPRHVHWTPI